jgi:hypothetical protein
MSLVINAIFRFDRISCVYGPPEARQMGSY